MTKPPDLLAKVTRARRQLHQAKTVYATVCRQARADHTLEEIAVAAGVTKAAIHKTLKQTS